MILHAKIAMPDSQRYPLNLWLFMYKTDRSDEYIENRLNSSKTIKLLRNNYLLSFRKGRNFLVNNSLIFRWKMFETPLWAMLLLRSLFIRKNSQNPDLDSIVFSSFILNSMSIAVLFVRPAEHFVYRLIFSSLLVKVEFSSLDKFCFHYYLFSKNYPPPSLIGKQHLFCFWRERIKIGF